MRHARYHQERDNNHQHLNNIRQASYNRMKLRNTYQRQLLRRRHRLRLIYLFFKACKLYS